MLQQQREIEMQRRLLIVQREAVQDACPRGLLSNSTRRELIVEIDRELSELEATSEP